MITPTPLPAREPQHDLLSKSQPFQIRSRWCTHNLPDEGVIGIMNRACYVPSVGEQLPLFRGPVDSIDIIDRGDKP